LTTKRTKWIGFVQDGNSVRDLVTAGSPWDALEKARSKLNGIEIAQPYSVCARPKHVPAPFSRNAKIQAGLSWKDDKDLSFAKQAMKNGYDVRKCKAPGCGRMFAVSEWQQQREKRFCSAECRDGDYKRRME
jgi:hypothetical protein